MSVSEGKKATRQRVIMTELALGRSVRTSELAMQLGVSAETVRRDIEELTRRGLVSRTYGGATGLQLGLQPGFQDRDATAVQERDAIARMAVRMVKPGDVLMIDSGSTTAHFARALAYAVDGLTVITNGLAVAQALAPQKKTRVVFCPGEFSADEGGVYGPDTCAFLDRFNANIAFIGASGLTLDGPNDVVSNACWVKRKMLERADRRVLLVTSSKFNRRHLELVCSLKDLSDVVTEAPPGEPLVEVLQVSGVSLHVSSTRYLEKA